MDERNWQKHWNSIATIRMGVNLYALKKLVIPLSSPLPVSTMVRGLQSIIRPEAAMNSSEEYAPNTFS